MNTKKKYFILFLILGLFFSNGCMTTDDNRYKEMETYEDIPLAFREHKPIKNLMASIKEYNFDVNTPIEYTSEIEGVGLCKIPPLLIITEDIHNRYYSRNTINEMCQFLLNMGADPNVQNDLGYTPLFYAAMSDNRALIEKLLDQYGADINFGRPVIFLSLARPGDKLVFDYYISRGMNVNCKLNGELLINRILTNEKYAVPRDYCDYLYEVVVKEGATDGRNDDGTSTFFLKCSNSGPEKIMPYFNGKYDVTEKNDKNQNALMFYMNNANTDTDIIQLFLNAGIGVNDSDNFGNTALHYATIYRDVGRPHVIALIENGADITIANEYGVTPAHQIIDNFLKGVHRYWEEEEYLLEKNRLQIERELLAYGMSSYNVSSIIRMFEQLNPEYIVELHTLLSSLKKRNVSNYSNILYTPVHNDMYESFRDLLMEQYPAIVSGEFISLREMDDNDSIHEPYQISSENRKIIELEIEFFFSVLENFR